MKDFKSFFKLNNDENANVSAEDRRKRRIILYIIIIIILLLLITSCSCTSKFFGKIGDFFKGEGTFPIDGDSPSQEVIKNKDLTFDTDTTEMYVSDSKTKISFSYKNIEPNGFTCSTSDPNIATCYVVNNYVVINPKKAGEVTVYLQTNANGKTYEATTKVIIKDINRFIELESTEGTINLRIEKIKNVVYRLVELTGEVTVTSSDESVATATAQDGILKITGLKVGTATITLSLTYNDRTYTNIYNINVINEKGNTTKPSTPSTSKPVEKNSDSTLRSLTINKGTLNFDPNTHLYYVGVGSWTWKVTLKAQATNPKATISYTFNGQTVSSLDKLKLNTGDNTVTITVTAEDGSKSVYTVIVNKAKSSKNYLKSLTTSKGVLQPAFNKNTLVYDIEVEHDVTSLDLTAIPKSKKAKITYTFNGEEGIPTLNNLKLNEGMNTAKILVTAEDGTSREYIVRINRKSAPGTLDKNSSLVSLTVSPGSIDFDPAKKEYSVGIDYNDKVTITAVPASDKATVTYSYNGTKYNTFSDMDLPVGENEVIVTVTAQDGSQTDYKVIVNKAPINKATYLTNLTTNKGTLDPKFNENTLEYKLVLEHTETDVTLTPTASSKSTITYTYKGKTYSGFKDIYVQDLEYGENEVIITVRDEEGNKRDYKVIIIRKTDQNLSHDSSITIKVDKKGNDEIQDLLSAGENKYKITVGEHVNEITFLPTLNHPNAIKMTYEYIVDGQVVNKGDVKDGKVVVTPVETGNKNILKITGLAEDGYTKTTYEITITKTDALGNANNLLKDLQAILNSSNKIVDFNQDKDTYTVEVGSNDEQIIIVGIPEFDKATVTYIVNGESTTESDGKVVSLKPGNNEVLVQVTAENGTPSETIYKVNIFRPITTSITINDKINNNKDIYLEHDPYNISYTIKTQDKDGNILTDEYDVNGVQASLSCTEENNICDLVEISGIEKDVIRIVPKPDTNLLDLIGKSVNLKLSYGDKEENTNLTFVTEKKEKLETANNEYTIALGKEENWSLVLNTDIFDVNTTQGEKIEKEPIEGGLRLYQVDKNGIRNPYVYIDITTEDHNLIEMILEKCDLSSPSSLTVPIQTLDVGVATINVKGTYYNQVVENKNFPVTLHISRKYNVTIDAGENGFFTVIDPITNKNLTKYTYSLDAGATINLANYHPYYDAGNCTYYDIKEFKDTITDKVYALDEIITVSDDLALVAVYDMDNLIEDIEITNKGMYYLRNINLFGEYESDKVIYPGANGLYEATVTNDLEDEITITGMTLEEETICIENMGCLNMGYIIKKEQVPESIYYYGEVDTNTRTHEERYTILNIDAGNINDVVGENYRDIKNNYSIRKIDFSNDDSKKITLKKGESVKLVIKWEWAFDSGSDALDTKIGENAANNIKDKYQFLLALNYEIVDRTCKK